MSRRNGQTFKFDKGRGRNAVVDSVTQFRPILGFGKQHGQFMSFRRFRGGSRAAGRVESPRRLINKWETDLDRISSHQVTANCVFHPRYRDARRAGLQVPPATLNLYCDGQENASEQRHMGAYGFFPVDVEFGNDRRSRRPRLSRAVG